MEPIKRLFTDNPKIWVIFGLLVALFTVTAIFEERFRGIDNLSNTMRWVGLYGIISIGVAFVIITGGIDLSIGSLIALTGVLTPMLLTKGEPFFGAPVGVPLTFAIVLAISALIGLFHGVMVTKMRIQPFLVTLCGLFIYRGFARAAGDDQTQGFEGGFGGLREGLVKHKIVQVETEVVNPANPTEMMETTVGLVPMSFVVMIIIIAVVAAIVLNKTVFGRYLLAIGHNEEAAKFSGIKTDRMKIAAYMICSLLGGFGGILFVLDTNGATPSSFGNFYELYAIAGAVLGGCSLRGGEGAIFGVICGAALVQVSEKAVFFLGVEEKWKFAVIGVFILIGVVADEVFRRWNEKRRRLS